MHCPKCGQQQVSEEVRFCSRCGFLLEGVTKLIASNGVLPVFIREQVAPTGERTPKQRGMRRGAKFVFWSVVIMPIIIAMSVASDSPGPLVIPFIIFTIGLMQILYPLLFGEELLPPRRGKKAPAEMAGLPGERGALPPSQGAPLFSPRTNTAEMVQPPTSVTEHTTRLLKDE